MGMAFDLFLKSIPQKKNNLSCIEHGIKVPWVEISLFPMLYINLCQVSYPGNQLMILSGKGIILMDHRVLYLMELLIKFQVMTCYDQGEIYNKL